MKTIFFLMRIINIYLFKIIQLILKIYHFLKKAIQTMNLNIALNNYFLTKNNLMILLMVKQKEINKG